ncbi:hypothetical protein P59_069 [Bacillus phage P59]|nr:hypothetical protein P59_069 [Bacillus phage P59]
MKKWFLGFMMSVMVLSLVACGFAEGVDSQFGNKAVEVFAEIDDDTMEVGDKELSDADDLANLDLLGAEADHKREEAFVKHVEEMVGLQEQVHNGDKESLKKYLSARKAALNSLGVSDDGMTVSEFGFYEED